MKWERRSGKSDTDGVGWAIVIAAYYNNVATHGDGYPMNITRRSLIRSIALGFGGIPVAERARSEPSHPVAQGAEPAGTEGAVPPNRHVFIGAKMKFAPLTTAPHSRIVATKRSASATDAQA